MSGVITAVVGTAAVATYMNYEQQRQAQSKADEKVKQEQIKMDVEKAWQNKKKGINDKNASQAALRLRGTADGVVPNVTPAGVASSGGAQTKMSPLGLLGMQQTPQQLAQNATQILNTPLGL